MSERSLDKRGKISKWNDQIIHAKFYQFISKNRFNNVSTIICIGTYYFEIKLFIAINRCRELYCGMLTSYGKKNTSSDSFDKYMRTVFKVAFKVFLLKFLQLAKVFSRKAYVGEFGWL